MHCSAVDCLMSSCVFHVSISSRCQERKRQLGYLSSYPRKGHTHRLSHGARVRCMSAPVGGSFEVENVKGSKKGSTRRTSRYHLCQCKHLGTKLVRCSWTAQSPHHWHASCILYRATDISNCFWDHCNIFNLLCTSNWSRQPALLFWSRLLLGFQESFGIHSYI